MNIFEAVKTRLKEYQESHLKDPVYRPKQHCIDIGIRCVNRGLDCTSCVWGKALELVDQVAKEHNDGWIPCSEKLPSEAKTYEVTLETLINSKKVYITEYVLFGTEGQWLCRDRYKVIAWREKVTPYQPKGCDSNA